MAEEKPRITAEEFATWLTPSAAINLLDHLDDRAAKIALTQCLVFDRVTAVAETAVSKLRFREYRTPLFRISAGSWKDLALGDTLWRSGQTILTTRTSHDGPIDVGLFNVRFNPDQVRAMLPPSRADSASPVPDAGASAPEEERGSPVSKTDLEAWAAVYKQAYGGKPEDTLTNALASAKGMFPGKFVSREKVRALVGGDRKTGRKPRAEE